jgi:hypothetical protein
MVPLTPTFLIAAAAGLVGLREDDARGGRMIEQFLHDVHQPPRQPWSAAFVYHVGYWAHFQYGAERSSWPLPATSSWEELAKFAAEQQVLVSEPTDGDVFLLWHAPTACFAHTGVVARVRGRGVTAGGTSWFECDTIEGNSDAGEHREDSGVMNGVVRRARRFYPEVGDRFIRWADLDRRWMAGQPFPVRLPAPKAA